MTQRDNSTLPYAAPDQSVRPSQKIRCHITSTTASWDTKWQSHAGKTAPPLRPIGKIPSDRRIKRCCRNALSP
jgi:hypothetical protein